MRKTTDLQYLLNSGIEPDAMTFNFSTMPMPGDDMRLFHIQRERIGAMIIKNANFNEY